MRKADSSNALTARQTELGRLILGGVSRKEIAARLGIAAKTVDNHIDAIKAALDVESSAEMIVKLANALNVAVNAPVQPDSNVVVPPTPLIGRQLELAEVTRLIKSHQLVSLVGAPGVGKTRVAMAVGSQIVGEFDSGTWFIDLTPLSNVDDLQARIAFVLRLSPSTQSDAMIRLTREIGTKSMLIIFDNCEHLVEPLRNMMTALLNDCRQLHVLMTTRRPLRVSEERTLEIGTLSFPTILTPLTLEDARHFAAISLFVDRAQANDRRFTLSTQNATVVGEICRRLDGIPLAIELAAARVTLLQPARLRDELNQRFRVLTRGRRDAPAHHQTLAAAIGWSYDLLCEYERRVLRRVAIFADGWTLDAAHAVCANDAQTLLDTSRAIQSLVEQSLMSIDSRGGQRYRLLESIRAFAGEKLAAANETDITALRQLRYYRQLFETIGEKYAQTRADTATRELSIELDNVRVSLKWALGNGQAHAAGALVVATHLWYFLGLYDELQTLLIALIGALAETDLRLDAELRIKLSHATWGKGEHHRGVDEAKRAVASASQTADLLLQTRAYGTLAYGAAQAGFHDIAAAAFQATETLFEGLEPNNVRKTHRMPFLEMKARYLRVRGELDEPAKIYEELLDFHLASNSQRAVAASAMDLAKVEHERGLTQRAIDILVQYLPQARESSSDVEAFVLVALAHFLAACEKTIDAREAAKRVLHLLDRTAEIRVGEALEVIALTFVLDHHLETAAQLAGYLRELTRDTEVSTEYERQLTSNRLMTLLQDGLEPGVLSALLERGSTFTQAEAIKEACENTGVDLRSLIVM